MVGISPIAPHHDKLQYIHHIHLMKMWSKPGCYIFHLWRWMYATSSKHPASISHMTWIKVDESEWGIEFSQTLYDRVGIIVPRLLKLGPYLLLVTLLWSGDISPMLTPFLRGKDDFVVTFSWTLCDRVGISLEHPVKGWRDHYIVSYSLWCCGDISQTPCEGVERPLHSPKHSVMEWGYI